MEEFDMSEMKDVLNPKKLRMCVLMTPDKRNFKGVVHGGEILKLLDQVAYACATRYCGTYVVTLSVDKVLFKKPIQIGSLVTFLASINYTGKTSCEVGIKVISENIKTREFEVSNSSYFTMISVDDDGKPALIKQFVPETPTEQKRYENAIKRRAARL